MAADLPDKGSRQSRDSEAAAADWLFEPDTPTKSSQPERPPEPALNPHDVFELAEAFGLDPRTLPLAEGLPLAEPAAGAPQAGARPAAFDQSRLDPSALVEEQWSRRAEWGPTLLIVGGWLALILLIFYVAFGQEFYGTAFLTLIVGGLIAVVLSYPILITLERPVRITPEQAVRDYYGSLSHHLPHFRRMWLLLSNAGRISTAFGSYDGFKAYWLDRLTHLRDGRVSSLTPLVFEIEDFTAERSQGKARIEVEFKVRISIRGRRASGAIQTLPAKIALVRGPDKMWYLENGMLPSPAVPVQPVQETSAVRGQ
jgi:hypothetical protein